MLKKFIIPAAAFFLGGFIVFVSQFSISDITGTVPSYTEPLTDEQFLRAQTEGVAIFYGSPTTDKNKVYSIETYIECIKSTSVCSVASANIINYTSGPTLLPSLDKYEITTWSEEGTITAFNDDECGRYSLQANIKDREVVLSYAANSNQDVQLCTLQPQDGNTRLDFNMSSQPLLKNLKSDIHYNLNKLFN